MNGRVQPGWRSSIQRPAKFTMVGSIGIVVQLAALEALTALGCHYLWATGLAVEAAVLHNFMWHQRFTWSDRGSSRLTETGVRMLRFHLSNGAISIFGSLFLVRWFVGQMGMRLFAANLLTIAACSVGNFLASDRWVFLSPVQAAAEGVITENRRADDFADGPPSEAGSAERKEHR
jgi:dolichol-phosphate mannosyltransferase